RGCLRLILEQECMERREMKAQPTLVATKPSVTSHRDPSLAARIALLALGFLAVGQTIHAQPARDFTSDAVGATAGVFNVDESGQATYSVAIAVPPGTAGVAPSLSLDYSSQGGTGVLGKGWSIGGQSSIGR